MVAIDYSTVSVVIPVFNRADRIEGAIHSALDQDPKPLEIIVVDDASTDGIDGRKLMQIDPSVKFIRSALNRGGGAARNTGIDAAGGAWVAFLDADDRWLPGKLKIQLRDLSDQIDGLLFSCGNVRIQGSVADGRLYNSRPPFVGEDISRYFLVHGCTFQTSTLLVPTKLARATRFDERLRRHQDWDFVLRLIKNGSRFLYSHRALAIYWDEVDANRVSKQKSIEPGLLWLRVAAGFLTKDAAAALYFRTIFRQHIAQQPMTAAFMALKFGFRDSRSTIWVLRRLPLVRRLVGS